MYIVRLSSALTLLALTALTARGQASATPPTRLGSAVFPWESLAPKPTPVGLRRDVADGPTPTLERFECHISTLRPGMISHPPHRHAQEEFIILKEGTLDASINGKVERVEAGSIKVGDRYMRKSVTAAKKSQTQSHQKRGEH